MTGSLYIFEAWMKPVLHTKSPHLRPSDKQSFVKAELVKPTKVGSLFLKSIRRVYLCRKTSDSFLFRWHRGITIFSEWVALSTVSGPLLNGEGVGDVSEQEGQSPGVRADNNYAYVSTWNCTINKYDSFIFLFHDFVRLFS